MRRFPGCWLFCLSLSAVPFCSAITAEPNLLALVPPASGIVAGIDTAPPPGQPGSFVLITQNNTVDLKDFFALTGVDSTRVVRHAIFVAAPGEAGGLSEHSLLMAGHFDRERIYQSAVLGGARAFDYRGVGVVRIQPFERERDTFNEVRWLAILDQDLLLFGTISVV